jgi:hypothetical protein
MRYGGTSKIIMGTAVVGASLIALGIVLPLTLGLGANDNRGSTMGGGIHLKGNVDMMLYDESGKIKDERHFDNLIVNSGLEGVASRIAPHDGSVNPTSPYNYIALGTNNNAVSASDTALVAELPTGASYSRLQDSTAIYSATDAGKKLILSVTFLPGQATGTLRESGIFDAATGGDMLARQTFADIQKAAGDTLSITWTISLSPT